MHSSPPHTESTLLVHVDGNPPQEKKKKPAERAVIFTAVIAIISAVIWGGAAVAKSAMEHCEDDYAKNITAAESGCPSLSVAEGRRQYDAEIISIIRPICIVLVCVGAVGGLAVWLRNKRAGEESSSAPSQYGAVTPARDTISSSAQVRIVRPVAIRPNQV